MEAPAGTRSNLELEFVLEAPPLTCLPKAKDILLTPVQDFCMQKKGMGPSYAGEQGAQGSSIVVYSRRSFAAMIPGGWSLTCQAHSRWH